MKKRKIKTRKIKLKYGRRFKTYRGGESSNKDADAGQTAAPLTPPHLSPPPPLPPPPSQGSTKKSLLEIKKLIPVSKLEGKGRMPDLPYEKRIQSDDANVIKMKKQEIENYIKDTLKVLKSSPSTSSSKKKTYQRRVKQMKPLTPPKIELSPRGRNLATTYTPTFDIVEESVRIPVYGKPHITTKGLTMSPFVYPYSHPLPLSFLQNPRSIKLTKQEREIRKSIQLFPITYEFLSPMLLDILLKINKRDSYADMLVIGKLRDELIPCIAISSRKTIESRTLLSDIELDNFMSWISLMQKAKATIGPAPFDHNEPEIPNIDVITPDTTVPDPTSLQVVGYNTHPMFKPLTEADKMKLLEMSEKHKKIKGEDFVFLVAHGSLYNELSPEMKLLANKYLRIIEIGKAGYSLRSYSMSFVFDVNKIMRDPKNFVMFDNNKEGAKKRKEIFNKLCPYMYIDDLNLCSKYDTFDLIDITHERLFEGFMEDFMIEENHKITLKNIINMKSMGFFVPINYERDHSTPYKHKKELFHLYPGTTFFSKESKFKLIEMLLPIAIRENKRINLLIFSCNSFYPNDDEIYNASLNVKPGIKNPAIDILTKSKRYISNLTRFIGNFLYLFEKYNFPTELQYTIVNGNHVFTSNKDYISENKMDVLYAIAYNIANFYDLYFLPFIYNNLPMGKIEEMFSFAGIGENRISNSLILFNQPLKDTDYYSYSRELIKVKIYLMKDMLMILSTRIYMLRIIFENLYTNIYRLRELYGPNPDPEKIATCNILDTAIYDVNMMHNYFYNLTSLIAYINDGLRNDPTDPDVFMSFTVFSKAMKEYEDTGVEKIYDELAENMDYDRYEAEPVGFGEMLYKASHLNPVEPGKFRQTARFIYKYKKLPNVDDIKERRKTMKQKLQKDLRVGSKARAAKDIHAVSV